MDSQPASVQEDDQNAKTQNGLDQTLFGGDLLALNIMQSSLNNGGLLFAGASGSFVPDPELASKPFAPNPDMPKGNSAALHSTLSPSSLPHLRHPQCQGERLEFCEPNRTSPLTVQGTPG